MRVDAMTWPLQPPRASVPAPHTRSQPAPFAGLAPLSASETETDPRLLAFPQVMSVHPPRHAEADAQGSDGDPGARSMITERNGIWVLTVGGVWRGDFHTRSQAEAASD
jgi:hypothetical protein